MPDDLETHRNVYGLERPMNILFLHGWQSTPGGLKRTYLKKHVHEVSSPALPDDDFDAAAPIILNQ